MEISFRGIISTLALLAYSIIGGVVYETLQETKDTEEIKPAQIIEMVDSYEYIEPVVFDGMTMTELSELLDRSLKHELYGKGTLIAQLSIEKEICPYMAVAIILHETGCFSNRCSRLVRECNNVGGNKSRNGGCGSFRRFDTIDDGIYFFINNLAVGYYQRGLNTPELINTRYATSTAWAGKIHHYIERVRNA